MEGALVEIPLHGDPRNASVLNVGKSIRRFAMSAKISKPLSMLGIRKASERVGVYFFEPNPPFLFARQYVSQQGDAQRLRMRPLKFHIPLGARMRAAVDIGQQQQTAQTSVPAAV